MNKASCTLQTAGLALTLLALAACSPKPEASTEVTSQDAAATELAGIKAGELLEQKHLATFDDLDFNVYTHQKWDELSRSHAQDILVHYPDGTTTTGLSAHIEMLKPMFVFAPDTRIQEHPLRLAQGNLTAVTGIMEGTFTQPMPIGDGKTLAPTGKAFKLDMATVGVWEDGVMKEEYLYWDNQALLKQIGLAE